jgi:hypothetical protein
VALRRFLALLVAIGLVGGAYVVRTKVIHKSKTTTTGTTTDPGNPGDPGNPTKTDPTLKPGMPLTVICIEELRASCDAASKATGTLITFEPAGVTLDRLAKADAATDPNTVWITLTGWDELLASAQKRSLSGTGAASPTQTLATTPVVITGPAERVDALNKQCAPLTWTCLGDQVGKRWDKIGGKSAWRDVEFVHTDPTTSASGLAAYAAAAAGRTGTPAFSSTELNDPTISAWSKRLEGFNHPAEADPIGRLASGLDFFLVGTLQALLPAGNAVATPSPAVRTGAIITAVGSPKIDPPLVTALKAALETNKWDNAVTQGVSGMPDAIALDAARTHWKQEN